MEQNEIKRKKLENEMNELSVQIILYSRKQLSGFDQSYHPKISHLMGSMVQLDSLAEHRYS